MHLHRSATLLAVVGVSLALLPAQLKAQQDKSGSRDHPLVTRMPTYYIDVYDVKEYAAVDKTVPSPTGRKDIHWEGKKYWIGYRMKAGTTPASELQIVRNYEAALAKIGGTRLGGDSGKVAFEIRKGAVTTGVLVETSAGGVYELTIVEMQAMRQDVTADAAAMGAELKAAGKTVLQGIFFATGSAVIKPGSDPALAEMVKLLKGSPSLKAFIVGHTDNVGTLDSNLKLSADRADALVKALVGRGIAAARLKSAGVGPYSPIASNKDEQGRAQNRRVEMVEQ